jgi:hypothetical protein
MVVTSSSGAGGKTQALAQDQRTALLWQINQKTEAASCAGHSVALTEPLPHLFVGTNLIS